MTRIVSKQTPHPKNTNRVKINSVYRNLFFLSLREIFASLFIVY